jgi:lysophospholipid hydrolase
MRETRVDFLEAFRLAHQPGAQVTADDLERYAPQWRQLIPPDHRIQATLAHLLGQKYLLVRDEIPEIRNALGMDDAAVQDAYQDLYNTSLTSIFALQPEPAERRLRPSPVPGIDGSILDDIETELEQIFLATGEALFRRGETADALYILTHGRMRMSVEDEGGERTLGEVGAGESLDAMTVLAAQPRATTVYASRDSDLVKLSKDGFDRLTEKHPRTAMQMVRTIVTRDTQQTPWSGRAARTVVGIAAVPVARGVPLSDFASRLTTVLSTYGPTLHLNSNRLDILLEPGAAQTSTTDANNATVVAWLSEQETRYRFIVYEADAVPSTWTARCLRQADRILLVGEADADPTPGEIEADPRWAKAIVRKELVLLHRNQTKRQSGTGAWLAHRPVATHHHVKIDDHGDLQRLVRRVTGRAIGVVLSGGGARGLAHIGVIRALEESGVPIDLIGGTSMGALVGACYGVDMNVEAMVRVAQRFGSQKQLLDYTVPLVSLMAGRKVTNVLQSLYGDAQIEDLRRPYFAVSSSLTRAQSVVHQHGPLWQAVRASISIPGIWPPILLDSDLLVDGGCLNNLPIDVMRNLCEDGLVVGVNVGQDRELTTSQDFGPSLSGWKVLRKKVRRTSVPPGAPSIAATLLRATGLGSANQLMANQHLADLVIRPPVGQFGMLEYEAHEQLIDVGYESAKQQIEAWRRAQESHGAENLTKPGGVTGLDNLGT